MTIKRVFIANRGEVCRRIARTCQRLGLESVTLWKEGQEMAAYLKPYLTRALPVTDLGLEHYLDAKFLVEQALASGCDCIHPGFGFLSENASFAEAVEQAGLIWVGPPPKAIAQMASKDSARSIAEQAGVPCVPGIQDLESASSSSAVTRVEGFAAEVGLPILIKAAAGGGGKGMRVVRQASEIPDALGAAEREALKAFGDGNLLVEKYVETARHVEVQVLADQHGQVFTLGTRDCSVQRRHQKIIEEAPALGLSPDCAAGLLASASALAKATGYTNAGTVEYLVTDDPQGQQCYYFLEMNTRLQVEHTVTEEIYQVDLVELQLQVAANQKLDPALAQLQPQGHAVQARIYAENPREQFLPCPGPVEIFMPPTPTDQLLPCRWELGMDPVDEVSGSFDPMVAKAIIHAGDRQQACWHLAQHLRRTALGPAPQNLGFLVAILEEADFRQQQPCTHYLQIKADWLQQRLSEAAQSVAEDQWQQLHGAINQARGAKRLSSQEGRSAHTQLVRAFSQQQPSQLQTQELDGLAATAYRTPQLHHQALESGGSICLAIADGLNYAYRSVTRFAEARQGASQAGHERQIVAPVPGKVVQVRAAAGDEVASDQTVFVLESMKMEFEVKAAKLGILEAVQVAVGQQVSADQVLAVWREE